jgi:hypothetical protein
VHVIWRHGQDVGVAFAEALHAEPAENGGIGERVARLESEIAGLKRVLKKLKTDTSPDTDVA